MIIGIDSGYTGALCIVDSDTISFFDMPLASTKKGKNILDIAKLTEIMRQYVGLVDLVYIESVHAMPSQGVSSTFRFGECYGAIQGVAVALGFTVKYVTPQAWKKLYGLIGSDKDYARTLAINNFPQYADMIARKKDIGRADALWIAQYGLSERC
jgi:crossover junction endodeoxyribonuclease RuvC